MNSAVLLSEIVSAECPYNYFSCPCRIDTLTREQGQKILLIDKITLKKASYPTKLLIFVISNIVIGKIYGT